LQQEAPVLYLWLKAFHVVAVIAWMAGLLYLPRLFAYHVKATPGSEMDLTFQTMERKLLRIIMNPAMVVAWGLGLGLIWVRTGGLRDTDLLTQGWLQVKLAGVVVVTAWHHYLGLARKAFAEGRNQRSERFWRASNELPFLAAIVMVLAVTLEFGA